MKIKQETQINDLLLPRDFLLIKRPLFCDFDKNNNWMGYDKYLIF